ncbi:MAG: hypothetical protein GXO54_02440 [Chloroflexi bacterium]|nr:hypothetical protein [Chloroflexota bacterium]
MDAATYFDIPLDIGGLVRVYPASHPEAAVLIFLHGWTGDETALQPFDLGFGDTWRAFFRAPFSVPEGLAPLGRRGFSWVPADRVRGSRVEDYRAAIQTLEHGLQRLRARFPRTRWSQGHWVGFSQGAATAAVFGLQYPQYIASYTGFVGYLPRGAEALVRRKPWRGKAAFLAHGRQDPLIPPARGEAMAEMMRAAGAHVTHCWGDAGHKVTAGCLAQWRTWLRERLESNAEP